MPDPVPTTSQDRSDETRRVFLITWHKCGSQWIRDLLTHQPIMILPIHEA